MEDIHDCDEISALLQPINVAVATTVAAIVAATAAFCKAAYCECDHRHRDEHVLLYV